MEKILSAVALALLIPLTHLSHLFVNEKIEQKIPIESIRFNLPSPEITKVTSIGYTSLIADIIWLQLIQYVGSTNSFGKYLPEMYSLIDTITTLDPYFSSPYTFGAFVLADNKEFDKAITILERAIKNIPDEWYFPYQLGFLYYINKKNKHMAAVYFERASKVTGAPAITKTLAANLYSEVKGSDVDFKISLWEGVYENAKKTKDKYNENKAIKNIVKLKIERDVENLNKAVSQYNEMVTKKNIDIVYPDNYSKDEETKDKENNVILPNTESPLSKDPENTKVEKLQKLQDLKELVSNKIIKKIPVDPFGRPYLFDPKTQKILSLPIPD